MLYSSKPVLLLTQISRTQFEYYLFAKDSCWKILQTGDATVPPLGALEVSFWTVENSIRDWILVPHTDKNAHM